MQLKPGLKLASQVCTTEVVVVRAPAEPVDLRCGGQPMVVAGETSGEVALDATQAAGTELGKRYGDDDLNLQVLCIKAGDGSLAVGDRTLLRSDTKALPSSD